MHPPGDKPQDPSKRIRPNRRIERAGVRAAAAVFEDANMLVQPVDGSVDIGKDLYVDLTENDRATGELVAIQVKSGQSYERKRGFAIPASPGDIALWAASTVPVIGIVYDPRSERLYWTNLTAWSRQQPTGKHCEALVEATWALDARTLPQLVEEVREFVRAAGPPALLGLAGDDPDAQFAAVAEAFALGRRDPRPMLILRASLRLIGDRRALRYAIHVLTLCVGHGDIFWHAGNWIDESVCDRVKETFHWSFDELVMLLSAADADEYDRGSVGEDIAALVGASNAGLEEVVFHAEHDAAWPALMLLVSDAGEDGLEVFERLVPRSRTLHDEPHVNELHTVLLEFGSAWLW